MRKEKRLVRKREEIKGSEIEEKGEERVRERRKERGRKVSKGRRIIDKEVRDRGER